MSIDFSETNDKNSEGKQGFSKNSKKGSVFKDLRERIICDYQPALMAASKDPIKPATFEERKLFFNLLSNRLEFRKVPWDLFKDYGFFVYVGELELEDSNVTSLCNDLLLDSLFEDYSSRNRLSIFPEIVSKDDIFATAVLSDKFDFVYRGKNGGYKYLPNISEKLHDVCSEKIKEFVSTGNFFAEIPDLFIDKEFIFPGWTPDLIIQVLKQGKNLTSILQLIQLGIRLGYLISRDEIIDSEILKEIDSIATKFVKEEIFCDEARTKMLRGSGYSWIFSGLPISQHQLKDLFLNLEKECKQNEVYLYENESKF